MLRGVQRASSTGWQQGLSNAPHKLWNLYLNDHRVPNYTIILYLPDRQFQKTGKRQDVLFNWRQKGSI